MITKEDCKNFALNYKQEKGIFPNSTNWSVKNGYPCALSYLKKQFEGSYTSFRLYCNEPILKRRESLSIDWIKSNCIIDDNNCWNWNKFCYPNGYGQISYKGKSTYLHRVVYELYYKLIPKDLLVRHKCDNKKCGNPEHLELGNHRDNTLDIIIRNSQYKPVNNSELISIVRQLGSLKEKLDFYLENIDTIESGCYISNLLKPQANGYLTIEFKNKPYGLHRLILADKLNKDYVDIDIARHTCHNKACINPEHLIEGNSSDNGIDSRHYSKQTKLTEEKVIQVKLAMLTADLHKRGNKAVFDRYWSNMYNVSINTISDIRLNKTWKNIIVN